VHPPVISGAPGTQPKDQLAKRPGKLQQILKLVSSDYKTLLNPRRDYAPPPHRYQRPVRVYPRRRNEAAAGCRRGLVLKRRPYPESFSADFENAAGQGHGGKTNY